MERELVVVSRSSFRGVRGITAMVWLELDRPIRCVTLSMDEPWVDLGEVVKFDFR